MEPIPQIVRQRMQAAARPEVHPDPDVLTALAENSLNEKERDRALLHLAICKDCREILSLAQPQFEPEYAGAAAAVASAPPRRGWFHGSVLRWGALAAGVVVVSAAVLLHYQSHPRLAAYSVAAPEDTAAVAREAPENRPPDQLAAASEKDKRAELKADARGERATLDFEAANDLAAKQQSAANVAKPDAMQQKKMAAPVMQGMGEAMVGAARARGAMGAAAGPAAVPPAFSARIVGAAPNKDEARLDAPQPPQIHSETVTVAAAPQPQAAQNAGESGLDAAAESNSESRSPTRTVGGMMAGKAVVSLEPQNAVALRKTPNAIPFRWTLSSDGSLVMRSIDSGKTWQTIPVAADVVFRAVSAVGAEVWAGGAAGALYHSSDAGQHWVQVKPASDGQTLSADIVAVEFSDAQHGRLTTATHEVWITSDAGQSWQKP